MAKKQSSANARNVHKRKFRRRAGPFCWLLSICAFGALAYFIFELIRLDILPVYMMIIICLVVILTTPLLIRFWLFRTRRPISRYFTGAIVVLMAAAYGLGGRYIADTSVMLDKVTDLTDKMANTVTVYAMVNAMDSEKDLDQADLGVMTEAEPQGTSGLLESLDKKGIHPNTIEYSSVFEMVDDLYNGNVAAIALPEQLHDALNEAANDENRYNALTTFTNTVDQYIYYTERDESMKNEPDPVSNIMRDPFAVLISGNDSYGTLNSVSRSDVNMLVAVNPQTAKILMVSLPRDTYTAITCKKSPSACESIDGQFDKLTHSGLFGVGATESSIEDLLDVPINYTVRLNFSSLINIVDAIGGVDVEVEPGLEVETFYANGTEGVKAGINHLNGERALAFARERHAYEDGDNQRVRNQQIVMKALIRSMISPSMVANYPKVMEALSTAFETNMSAKEIKRLITLELTRFPDWDIQSVSLMNTAATEYSPSNQSYSSVTLADTGQLETVHNLIMDVLEGRNIELPDIMASSSGVFHTSDGEGVPSQEIYTQLQTDYYDPYGGYQNEWSSYTQEEIPENGYEQQPEQPDLYDPYAPLDPSISQGGESEPDSDGYSHYSPDIFVEPLP